MYTYVHLIHPGLIRGHLDAYPPEAAADAEANVHCLCYIYIYIYMCMYMYREREIYLSIYIPAFIAAGAEVNVHSFRCCTYAYVFNKVKE